MASTPSDESPQGLMTEAANDGGRSSVLGGMLAAYDSLPEAKRPPPNKVTEVVEALYSLLFLQAGIVHPDLKEAEREKAGYILRDHRALLDAYLSLQNQTPSVAYEPGAAPVYRLPLELIARIFVLFAEWSPDELTPYASPIALTQVCRSWRTLAENTPQLWARMPMKHGLEWTRRALQCSQNASLDVSIHPCRVKNVNNYQEALRSTLEQLPRISSLEVVMSYGEDVRLLLEVQDLLRSKPASKLVKLEYDGSAFESPNDLDRRLFAGACPGQLRIAKLRETVIRLSCPIFHSPLTTLSLKECSVWESVDEMMRTLKGLPSLEHFKWIMNEEVPVQIDPRERVDSKPRSVQLSQLQTLELQDELPLLLNIFACLEVPPSTSILIHGQIESVIWGGSLDDTLVHLDNAFGTHLSAALGDESFKTLSIVDFAGSNDQGYSAVFEEPSAPQCPQRFMLGFCFLSDYVDEFTRLLAGMLSWGPCSRAIHQINIRYDLEFLRCADTWKVLLERLPLVEEIQVLARSGTALLSYLTEHLECAPALRRVVIREAKGLAEMDINEVVKSLDARSAAGLPKLSLSMINCDITEDQVVALEECASIEKVFCYPRVTKELIDAAKRFGFEVPLTSQLTLASGGGIITP
ncbi:unnamed protein product [Peniophora sp. CBMAI 1063]|nr:unnamed protein product [Peniophora sp. CBMAI 1063]